MWKLLASTLGVGVAFAPVTATLAADPAGQDPTTSIEDPLAAAALDPLDREQLERQASRRVRDARQAADRRHRRRRTQRRRAALPDVPVPGVLQSIAACESGGNPRAIGGGGAFRGKYQFTYETWAAVGGSGDPAAAPEGEQDRRAALLYARSGSSPWPVCGR